MTPLQEDITCYIFAGIFALLLIGYFFIVDIVPNTTWIDWVIDFGVYSTLVFMIGIFLWIARKPDYIE
ncbi:MAG: hypothetical protein R2685_10750 [Candidatus Nitrosocosmicus sp.]|nr:hypothetical protein [Candidatus Nitrosocosmicus sp.]